MRGEHFLVCSPDYNPRGSSPHARGTLIGWVSNFSQRGIIPACAGNTGTPWPEWLQQKDHPRMRGEHIPYQIGYRLEVGSSPHARGTLEAGAAHGWNLGIIPACAGNTSAIHGRANGARDHPRMRGEHIGEIFQFRSRRGSSPHARGTRIGNAINEPRNGIIPAGAGNTRHLTVFCKLTWDHPRMRGEHPLRRTLSRIVAGSSPHARGTLFNATVRTAIYGIIPACAGNTTAHRHRILIDGDHPRMRGEH